MLARVKGDGRVGVSVAVAAPVAGAEGGAAAAVDAALKVFAIRRMITRPDAEIAPDPSAPPLLAFYAAQVLQMQEKRAPTNARI